MNWEEFYVYDEASASCLRRAFITKPLANGDVSKRSGSHLISKNGVGYFIVRHCKVTYRIHRIIWEMFYGEIPDKMYIDHIDGNHTNNKICNLRLVDHGFNMRNRFKNKNSGDVLGVQFISQQRKDGTFYEGWRANWIALGEKHGKAKTFSFVTYGEDAFRLACEHRDKMIQELNSQGAGYSERHGENRDEA